MSDKTSASDFWEARYGEQDRIWSGKVNRVLADVASALAPGTALDLGCGEGSDAVWLAQHGWTVTGVDLSTTAVRRGNEAVAAAGLASSVHLEAADLATWTPTQQFDLVSASFLHAFSVPLPRDEILRRATTFVAPGGRMLIISHVGAPSWSDPAAHGREFPTPQADLELLCLGDDWEVDLCEIRERAITAPDGSPATLDDGVVLVHRVRRNERLSSSFEPNGTDRVVETY